MENQSAKQTLIEDIKREVLADLNRVYGRNYQEQCLMETIKREVLMELDHHHREQQSHPDRALVEAVKNEVLSNLQREARANPASHGSFRYPNKETIESIKKEVMAQVEAEQEIREESYTQKEEKMMGPHNGNYDPALVQAIKNSVMAKMNIPHSG